MASDRYWSYTPDYADVCWHETAEDARATCEAALAHWRGDAVDGWDAEAGDICWGVVIEEAKEGKPIHHLDECTDDHCDGHCPIPGHPWDYTTDYSLEPVKPEVPELPDGYVYQSRPDGSHCLFRDGRRYSISRSGGLYADCAIPMEVARYLIARWEVTRGE